MGEAVYLIGSYDSVEAAERAVVTTLQGIINSRQSKGWRVESEGERPYMKDPSESVGLRVDSERTFKMRDRPYEGGHPSFSTEYICGRVISGFKGPIVSQELFEFIGMKWELNQYFEFCAENEANGKPRPFPEMDA